MEIKENTQFKLNKLLSVARVFAILSVVSAHISIKDSEIVSNIINVFGSIGVTVFFIMSGYFYRTTKFKNIFGMLNNKFKTIVIPWFVLGALVYLYVGLVTHSAFSFKELFLWIVGYKTYLYYISMLMLCYVIYFKKNTILLYISMVINILSVYLTALGYVDFEKINLTNYLNLFNWIGYFSLGLLMQGVSTDKILLFIKKIKYPSIFFSILLYVIICIFNIPTGYFSIIGMPFQLLCGLAIISISSTEIFSKYIIHTISNMTFSVYLIHMPLIGILSKIYNKSVLTQLLSPLIVTIVCVIFLYLGYLVSTRVRVGKIYCYLTGLRMNRNIQGE